MSTFEIKYQTKIGLFHIILNDGVTNEEAIELSQLALNVLKITSTTNDSKSNNSKSIKSQSPESRLPQVTVAPKRQSNKKLGENLVSKEDMDFGSYIEPKNGVRMQMLDYPNDEHRVEVVKFFREKTKIPLKASCDIIKGNFECPILDFQIANELEKKFRELNVYAKFGEAKHRTTTTTTLCFSPGTIEEAIVRSLAKEEAESFEPFAPGAPNRDAASFVPRDADGLPLDASG